MSFDTVERIIAADQQVIADAYPSLIELYAEQLPDGSTTIPAIAAHWDNVEKTRIRAASLERGSAAPIQLTDGRVAFVALWNKRLLEAFEHGELSPLLDELTHEELAGLTPAAQAEP